MKAMILSAGQGKRLRPLTEKTPKPLLQVGQQRLIEYHLMALGRAGFSEAIVNCSYQTKLFQDILGDGSQYGIKVTYSVEPEGGLETGGGILKALPILGHEPFLVVNADIWTDYPFAALYDFNLSSIVHLVLIEASQMSGARDFSLEGNRVISKGPLTYSGISVLDPILFEHSSEKKFSLAPLLHQAASLGHVTGERYDGRWYDVGTPERLTLVRELAN